MCHALSRFNEGPLIRVNCPALPKEQIEAELFGAATGVGGVEHARVLEIANRSRLDDVPDHEALHGLVLGDHGAVGFAKHALDLLVLGRFGCWGWVS